MLRGCAEWFAASGASVFIRESATRYVLAAKSGTDSTVPDDATVVPGSGIAGACIASGEPMVVKDPERSPALRGRSVAHNANIGSAMVIPLVTPESGCVGVLNLSRRPSDSAFGEEDLSLARSLGGYLALSVANARLVGKLNQALSESRQLRSQIETVIASVGVAILAIDAENKLIRANPEAAGLFQAPPSIGEDWPSLKGHLPAPLSQAIEQVFAGATRKATARIPQKVGTLQRTYSVVGSSMADGWVFAIHDHSEFERTQEELARVKRLAEIGQMAAAIAHEIRNPLTGIRGAAQMIAEDTCLAAEFSRIIDAEVCKLNTLCEDFLDFAKPLRLNFADLRLGAIFEGIADRLSRAFEERGVAITVDAPANEPTIKGDPLRIEQVAHNLLRNALEACESGGIVEVKVSKGSVRVKDNGCGMSEEALEHLFVPFHTTKPGGTGLGLGVSRRILDAHGASVRVKSKVGKGTEFEIQFPLREAA